MKKLSLISMSLLLLVACEDSVKNHFKQYEPVYTDYEAFRVPPVFESSRSITEPGQIYTFGEHIFVVENGQGIHFIDNSEPTAPSNYGFLAIKGCSGMAIRGNLMYVNSFIDLVVMDITTMTQPVEVSRILDAFPLAVPEMEKNYPVAAIDKNLGVVTSWNVREIKEKAEDDMMWWNNCWNCFLEDGEVSFNSTTGSASASTGTAGSITKFTILNDYLYVIDGFSLRPFDISGPVAPVVKPSIGVWGDVETLFPYENYLFMGTPSGMLIYSVETPDVPTYMSDLGHARGCDPVVVKDDFAYVTVRSGGPCGGTVNQLDVIDVSDVYNPVLLAEFEMKNPHGLGVAGNRLFLCDGKDGLKVFDISNPSECGNHLVESFKDVKATDVIPLNGMLMMIGEDGLYQYNYASIGDMKLVSTLKF